MPANRIMRGMLLLAILLGAIVFEVVRQSTSLQQPPAPAHDPAHDESGCEKLNPDDLPDASGAGLYDITDDLNLDFEHVVGPLGTYFMPESIGAGGALFDANGDGRLELYLVNCGQSPEARGEFAPGTRIENRFFQLDNSGQLIDMTAESGLGDTGYGAGCAVGDADNDGDLDVYVTNYGADRLYLNQGDATFSDFTQAAGIDEADWGTCAAFLDYNRDGWLDLIVVNYTADSVYQHSVGCGFTRGIVSYCGPHKFEPTIDRLWRNDGITEHPDGSHGVRFTDVTESSGLADAPTYGFGVVCADFNNDGWIDIYVANDGAPNRLWINQEDGRFLDEAAVRGVALNGHGQAEAGMGVAAGDVDAEGSLDLAVTNLTGERTRLYTNTSTGEFADITAMTALEASSGRHTGWGVALIDMDHDGFLDMPIVNGLVVPCYSRFPFHGEDKFVSRHDVIEDPAAFWQDYADANGLYFGDPSGRFRDETASGGDFTAALGSGRALIHGDLDDDGDIDLVVTNCGGRTRLYRNDFPKRGHWLQVRAVDPELNRDAIGAVITVVTGSQTRRAVLSPSSGYLASNDFRVHFGLGTVERYDRIVVQWPDGPIDTAIEEFEGGAVDRLVTLRRSAGQLTGTQQ